MPLRSAVMSVFLAVLLFLVTCPNGGLLKQDPLNVARYCGWLARLHQPTEIYNDVMTKDDDGVCYCNITWLCRSEVEPADYGIHKEENLRKHCFALAKKLHAGIKTYGGLTKKPNPKNPDEADFCRCLISWDCCTAGENEDVENTTNASCHAFDSNGDGYLTLEEFASTLNGDNGAGNSTMIYCGQ